VPLTPGGNMSLPSLVPPPRIKVESMNSAAGSSLENLDVDRGVYDTSHKKRVPSWYVTFQPSFISKFRRLNFA
jgi:hypothetical protein